MKMRGWVIPLLLVWYLLLSGIDVRAEPDSTLPEGVVIRLMVTKDKIILGDPLPLQLRIENGSGNYISFLAPATGRFEYRTISFYVCFPGREDFYKLRSPGVYVGPMKIIRSPKTIPVVTLPPKGMATFDFVLDYDFPTVERRKWLFPVAGTYRVKAALYLLQEALLEKDETSPQASRISVETLPLDVRIIEPEGEEDIQAYADMRRLTYDYLLYAPEMFHPRMHREALEETEGFITKHAKSRYASFGKLFIGYVSFVQAEQSKNINAMQNAIDLYQGLGADVNFPLASKAKELSARMSERFERLNKD